MNHVLVADPPWPACDKLPGKGRGSAKHYRSTMTLDDIIRFDLPPLHPNAWLFLWRVAWAQQEALDVCRAWGFTVKAEIVWVKREPGGRGRLGMGHYVRNVHETCLIATSGRAAPLRISAAIPSLLEAAPPMHPGTRKVIHSAKPEKFYDMVERLVHGPYAEIFARRRRPGWECSGLEVDRREPKSFVEAVNGLV